MKWGIWVRVVGFFFCVLKGVFLGMRCAFLFGGNILVWILVSLGVEFALAFFA